MDNACRKRIAVDSFVILTGRPLCAGHLMAAALQEYRRAMGIPAKLVMVAMTEEEIVMSDPAGVDELYVAGFDASVPAVIGDFLRG